VTVPPDPRQLLLRYVLHELPADERAAVDQALITDQNAFDRLQEARYDLIDAYVAEELSPVMRGQVERAFLLGQEGQAAVAVAIPLRRSKSTANPDGISAIPAKKNAAPSAAGAAGRLKNVMLLSGLAAGLLVAAVLIDLHRSDSRSLHPKLAIRSSDSATLAARAPSSAAAAPPSSPKLAAIPQPNPQARIATLAVVLPADTPRGLNQLPVRLHSGVQHVEFQWLLAPENSGNSFVMEIAFGGQVVGTLPQRGPIRHVGNLRVVNFLVPVAQLPAGSCILRLRAAQGLNDLPIAERVVSIQR
jgi:anti-sigma factor RsiW